MAENFPMSLRQLLPILDIVGAANKHLARAGKFLQKYGNMDLFPVKMQVQICSVSSQPETQHADCNATKFAAHVRICIMVTQGFFPAHGQ